MVEIMGLECCGAEPGYMMETTFVYEITQIQEDGFQMVSHRFYKYGKLSSRDYERVQV